MNKLNSQGLICGPEETSDVFHQRCSFFKQEVRLEKLLKENLPKIAIMKHSSLSYPDLDLEIDWLFFFSSRKGLSTWEAAATWTVEVEGVSIPVLQLKPPSKRINHQEILKHEAIHIVRSAFDEPIYEEFLAYAPSKSRWRRYFGPIFRSPKEAVTFVLLSFIPLVSVWTSLPLELWFIPLGVFFAFLLGRLFYYHHLFNQALSNIKKLFNLSSPLKIALRLTDKEIFLFASSTPKEMKEYIENRQDLRWRQILASYEFYCPENDKI
jgi:hypothetical protein